MAGGNRRSLFGSVMRAHVGEVSSSADNRQLFVWANDGQRARRKRQIQIHYEKSFLQTLALSKYCMVICTICFSALGRI